MFQFSFWIPENQAWILYWPHAHNGRNEVFSVCAWTTTGGPGGQEREIQWLLKVRWIWQESCGHLCPHPIKEAIRGKEKEEKIKLTQASKRTQMVDNQTQEKKKPSRTISPEERMKKIWQNRDYEKGNSISHLPCSLPEICNTLGCLCHSLTLICDAGSAPTWALSSQTPWHRSCLRIALSSPSSIFIFHFPFQHSNSQKTGGAGG